MSRRVIESTLNATTVDILNVIRQNASYQYQQNVPVVTVATEIPKVGEILFGHPALANEFINALVNRIALVAAKSATFNNPFAILKKGELAYGETVEEIFVELAKVVHYDADDAVNREFRRTYPDARSAFHAINWKAMYPVTVQHEELQRAFLSEDGVQELITRIINSIYTAVQYDEFLLTKYLLIKGCNAGEFKPVYAGSTLDEQAGIFRGTSNMFQFISRDYNLAGVRNACPRERQVIIMPAIYNGYFDVGVLAAAFNMDKADFLARLILIDNFTDFDNERFDEIRAESDGLEQVTSTELSVMEDVVAILVDEDWFQIYDNLTTMRETPVSSGLYWNYFYHTWRTVSSSPFADAVVFVAGTGTEPMPSSLTLTVESKSVSDAGTVLTFSCSGGSGFENMRWNLVQTPQTITDGIAVVPAGAVIIPDSEAATTITLVVQISDTEFTATSTITSAADVGDTVTLTP